MSKPDPIRYRRTNRKTHNKALKKRRSPMIWFDRDMAWFGVKTSRL
ncbi:hypothetical protein JMM63_00055 [Rhodovulum sulfidophilum]|nr:hypothetical protein [Rhodovulum sulfidophilum]